MNEHFNELHDSLPERTAREQGFRKQKWIAFVRECLLFDLICLGVGIGGTICGLICGDTAEAAIVRFAYGVFGVVLGAVYGFARAIWYLFRESMYGEIPRSKQTDPMVAFRWNAWVFGIGMGSVMVAVPGERQNQLYVALSGLTGGIAVAIAIRLHKKPNQSWPTISDR